MHSPQLAAGIFISPITRQCIRPSPFTHQLTSLPMVVAGQGLAIGVAIVPNGGSFAGDAVDSLKPPGWPGYLPPHSGRSPVQNALCKSKFDTALTSSSITAEASKTSAT